VARRIQRDEAAARRVLERLVEAGLVEAHGVKRGRSYTLSAGVYRRLGSSIDYVRQAGFGAVQQEQMVLTYVARHGGIRRRDVTELCRISDSQAKRLLARLVAEGRLARSGERKGTTYGPSPSNMGAAKSIMGDVNDRPKGAGSTSPDRSGTGSRPGSPPFQSASGDVITGAASPQRPPAPVLASRSGAPIPMGYPGEGVPGELPPKVTVLPGPTGPS
jgi:ATP-dependent DNA helicase RecG